ncbi:hypothetical protein G6F57_016317 [Rhizopus arrhizus]|nr:hypothetical protein G6F57_016317 [Rhizopus arrhizus]
MITLKPLGAGMRHPWADRSTGAIVGSSTFQSRPQRRERHLLDQSAGGDQGQGLQQQIGFHVGAQAVAVTQLVQGFDRDQPAFAARHPMQRGFGADLVVFGQIRRIAQQQARETVAAATLDQHGLALGDQALHVFVVPQVFARLAIKNFQPFALAGAVQDVHQARRLDHLALLIHEDARVVLLARGLLDARQQLDHVVRCRRRVCGARGFVRGQESGQKRGGEPASAMRVPGSSARPTCR